MPVTGHVEPHRESAMRSISRIPPGDGTIRSAPGAGVAAPVLLAHPGIERQEVVASQNSQETFRGVGTEAVLELDRGANLLGGCVRCLPPVR